MIEIPKFRKKHNYSLQILYKRETHGKSNIFLQLETSAHETRSDYNSACGLSEGCQYT